MEGTIDAREINEVPGRQYRQFSSSLDFRLVWAALMAPLDTDL